MLKLVLTFVAGLLVATGVFFVSHKQIEAPVTNADKESVRPQANERIATTSANAETNAPEKVVVKTETAPVATFKTLNGQKVLTQSDLLALADNKYADGSVPLGDNKYVTDAPKKGYVYLCNVRKDNPGSMVAGSWIHGTTWNFLEKISISGAVSWPNALFSNIISAGTRVLSGNGLPINHITGTFPVAASDPASKIDGNPNTISAQTMKQSIPADPTYSDTPYCMGGEVGIMLSGVPLFNGFDAGLRDAVAHEVQDSCDGHPQERGQYHYHGLSSCFKDTSVSTVLGYAYDGFPITGPLVEAGKYLTTEDLDVCHGITSEIVVDGVKRATYHYVMTQDFPYSASCFRGKSYMTRPAGMPPQRPSQGPPR